MSDQAVVTSQMLLCSSTEGCASHDDKLEHHQTCLDGYRDLFAAALRYAMARPGLGTTQLQVATRVISPEIPRRPRTEGVHLTLLKVSNGSVTNGLHLNNVRTKRTTFSIYEGVRRMRRESQHKISLSVLGS